MKRRRPKGTLCAQVLHRPCEYVAVTSSLGGDLMRCTRCSHQYLATRVGAA